MSASRRAVVVFGSTGAQGGSVVRALVGTEYLVRAVTRNTQSQKATQLRELGCDVYQADLDDKASLSLCMQGAYAMFLNTTSWEHRSADIDYKQGVNALEVAKECGVDHVIYSGQEHVQKLCGIECAHCDGKGLVEEYLVNSGLKFTVVRLSFYMENLFNIVPLEKYADGTLGISIPMKNHPLYMVSVRDIGTMIFNILEQRERYLQKVIGLTGDKLTIQEMADKMTEILGVNAYDAKISLEHYRQLNFDGCGELVAMFEFYQKESLDRDLETSRMLNPHLSPFAEWVMLNKQAIFDVFM